MERMLKFFDSFLLLCYALGREQRHLSLYSYQIPDPHKIIGCDCELEYPSHLGKATVLQFSQLRHGLEPPKYFLYPFALLLADSITGVPGRSPIYRRPSTGVVLRDVRRHVYRPKLVNKPTSVVSLISSHRRSSLTANLASEHNSSVTLRSPSRSRSFGIDSKSVPIFHKQMTGVIEFRFFSFSLLAQQRLGIGCRFMGLIRAFLTVKVHGWISRIIRWRSILSPLFSLETLESRRRLDQSPVNRKGFVAEQPMLASSLKNPLEKHVGNFPLRKSLPVLGERCRIPNLIVHAQPDKPAEQEIVIKLLHQHPLATDAVEHFDQQRPQQLLRCDRRSSNFRIQPLELCRHLQEYLIDHLAHWPKRMVTRNSLSQRSVAEHFVLLKIVSTHSILVPLVGFARSLLYTTIPTEGYLNQDVSPGFSAAC